MIHHENIIVELFLNFIRYQIFFLCFTNDVNSRSVLIMNNAQCHRDSKLKIMCKNVNVILIFLFSYFSNYNFIEISFAILKIYIRKNIEFNLNYASKIEKFDRFLKNALHTMQKTFFNHKNEKENFNNLFKLTEVFYS